MQHSYHRRNFGLMTPLRDHNPLGIVGLRRRCARKAALRGLAGRVPIARVLASEAGRPSRAGVLPGPGILACGRQRYSAGPLPSGLGDCYFFPFFLLFLLFLATRITPLPGSAGQRNVDHAVSTYH
jgi:hypothetical protein